MTSTLTDLDYVLLATAARRSTGCILRPSADIGVSPVTLSRAIASLVRRGLAEEVPASAAVPSWRTGKRRGRGRASVITTAGREAVMQSDAATDAEQSEDPI